MDELGMGEQIWKSNFKDYLVDYLFQNASDSGNQILHVLPFDFYFQMLNGVCRLLLH